MNNLIKFMAVGSLAVMGISGAYAKTVYWGGATSGIWAVGNGGAATGGWLDAPDGSPTTFEEGDSVVFGDAPNTVTITAEGQFSVGDLTFSASNKYMIKARSRTAANLSGLITSLNSFQKTGSGELQFEDFTGNFECDIELLAGNFNAAFTRNTLGVNPATQPQNTLIGNVGVARTIRIGSGDAANRARIQLKGAPYNAIAGFPTGLANTIPAATFLFDGGILDGATENIAFGDIILRNKSELLLSSGPKRFYNGDIRVARREDNEPSAASTIQENSNYHKTYLGAAGDGVITFDVEEVTATANGDGTVESDGVTDFYIKSTIANSTEATCPNKSGFIKTGAGTLEFAPQSYHLGLSGYTGDITIQEGTVVCASANGGGRNGESVLGRYDTVRTIKVCPGASLVLNNASIFGAISADSPIVDLVVTNGTLKFRGAMSFSNLTLQDQAQLVFLGYDVNMTSVLKFGERTVFQLERPFTFDLAWMNEGSGENRTTLQNTGLHLDKRKYQDTDALTGFSELCVEKAKIHEDDFADLTLGLTIRDSSNYRCGLEKTGPGVLRIDEVRTSTGLYQHDYRGDTVAAEGGIVLNALIKGSLVAKRGGVIGGIGRAQGDFTVEEGGGFLVDTTDETTLAQQLTVDGTLTLPQAGLVKLYNVDTTDVSQIAFENLPLPNCATIDGLDDLDPEAWKVEVDGVSPRETRNLKVTFNGLDTATPTYSIAMKIAGTYLFVK